MMAILVGTTMVILMEAMMDGDESPRSHIQGQHCLERNHTANLIVDQSCIKVEPKLLVGHKGMYLFSAHHLHHFPHAICRNEM